jgi:hypothetical protein
MRGGFLERVRGMWDEGGGAELDRALDAGLLTIDPVVGGNPADDVRLLRNLIMAALGREDDDIFLPAFVARLDAIVADRSVYPLFDSMVAAVVRERASELLIELNTTTTRRGKKASIAPGLMEAMPSFPNATISEVIDIRSELETPLLRFRGAIVEMERMIASASFEPDFQGEVDDLYAERVAPALVEIND